MPEDDGDAEADEEVATRLFACWNSLPQKTREAHAKRPDIVYYSFLAQCLREPALNAGERKQLGGELIAQQD